MEKSAEEGTSALYEDARKERQAEYDGLRQSNGSENPYRLHAELADVMWNKCGIWRTQKDLLSAREDLDALTVRHVIDNPSSFSTGDM